MNTNLNQLLIETINQSKEVLGEGLGFAKEQTPLLIQEFLAWKFWSSLIVAVACLVVVGIAVRYLIRLWKWSTVDIEQVDRFVGLIASLVITFSIIGITIFSLSQTCNALKIKIAPRVYIVEYVAETIKGK